ncbi:hypothetical protein HF072_00535 [Bacillus sp. RO3]|nr:hypothetical protein [Bacillus sp. RO3]
MNDRAKEHMKETSQALYDKIKQHFSLPTFEDDIAEDELPADFNYFLIVYGDMQRESESRRFFNQDVFVVYLSENNDQVNEDTLDIISIGESIKTVTCQGTVKERIKKNDSDQHIDRVTINFVRKIKYDSGQV